MLLAVAVAAATARGAAGLADGPIPVAQVDLDGGPHKWSAVIDQYNATLWASLRAMERNHAYRLLLKAADAIAHDASAGMPAMQWAEIVSIARRTRVPVGTLIALNGLYDLTASNVLDGQACTSVLAQATDGTIVHGRNLDYGLREYMLPITLAVQWTRGGDVLFTSVSYVGLVGFNTVLRHGAWSLSQAIRSRPIIHMISANSPYDLGEFSI